MQIYPKISIITPTYNQSAFIKQTIESILRQDYPNLEYIVIDGGSSDGTIEILKKYQNKIIWQSEKDQGQSDAINKGLHIATGEIIAFLNSDDLYLNNSLFAVAEYFYQHPQKKWLYGKCKIINENNTEIRKTITFYKNLLMKNYSYNKLLCVNFICQPATFWRREIINEFGDFNIHQPYTMDYEYWLRIGKKYPAGFINNYLAEFRIHQQSKSSNYYQQQFIDDYNLVKKFTNNKLLILLHYLHNFFISLNYRIINKIKI